MADHKNPDATAAATIVPVSPSLLPTSDLVFCWEDGDSSPRVHCSDDPHVLYGPWDTCEPIIMDDETAPNKTWTAGGEQQKSTALPSPSVSAASPLPANGDSPGFFNEITADPANFWADLEDSDDEADEPAEVAFERACADRIPFRKKRQTHRGETLGALVRTKNGRSYLRYMLAWDGLHEDLHANMECVMAAYAVTTGKDGGGPSKKRKRK